MGMKSLTGKTANVPPPYVLESGNYSGDVQRVEVSGKVWTAVILPLDPNDKGFPDSGGPPTVKYDVDRDEVSQDAFEAMFGKVLGMGPDGKQIVFDDSGYLHFNGYFGDKQTFYRRRVSISIKKLGDLRKKNDGTYWPLKYEVDDVGADGEEGDNAVASIADLIPPTPAQEDLPGTVEAPAPAKAAPAKSRGK